MACCASPGSREKRASRGGAEKRVEWTGAATTFHSNDDVDLGELLPRRRHSAQVSKATYAANAPNEDRHTVVLGDDCMFAGVWDGHGGSGLCAEYLDRHMFTAYQRSLNASGDPTAAFAASFKELDGSFIADAEKDADLARMCCGACAVGAFVRFGDEIEVTIGNAGDCRAVCGYFEGSGSGATLEAKALSSDHSVAASASERARLRGDFPGQQVIVSEQVDESEELEDGTVLGLCRFTRGLGDGHLKSPACTAAFNEHHARKGTGLEVPALRSGGPVYISSVPECTTSSFTDGFLVLACDGVWDEMDNRQAVRTAGKLLLQHRADPTVNIAELFIDQVIKNAAARIADEVEGEEDMTARELRRRPCGKAPGARSSLHDDITVVIVDFMSTDEGEASDGPARSTSRQHALQTLSPATSPMSSPDSPFYRAAVGMGSTGGGGSSPVLVSSLGKVGADVPPLYRTNSNDFGAPTRLSPRQGPRGRPPAGRLRPRSSSDRLTSMLPPALGETPPALTPDFKLD